jgi:hypothetical protein
MLLHSLKFDIQSKSIPLGEHADGLYRSNDLIESFPRNKRVLSLHLELADSPHSLQIEPITHKTGEFAEIGLLGGMCWFAEGRFYSAGDGDFRAECEFNPADAQLRVNLGGRYGAVGADALLALVMKQIMQSFVLPFYGLKFLHGAVIARDGATIMLTGKGGAGKSTTALRLLEEGYILLSDDGPLFTYCDDTAWALSSLDSPQVTATTLEILPFIRDAIEGERDHRGKYRIRAHELQPDESWRVPHRVTHIVRLDRRECAEPHFVEMSPSLLTAELMSEAMTVFRSPVFADEMFRSHSRFSFDVIASLMRDVEVLGLEFANEQLDTLPSLFDELKHG